MNALDEIRRRLSQVPQLRYVDEQNTISVPAQAPGGFDVTFSGAEPEHTVFFEGWHEHFSDSEEAMKCFLFGLSSRCRIKVSRRGGKAHKWTLEAFEDGKWIPYGTTGLLWFRFWLPADTAYLQNHVFDS
jgi:hypothetical protein